METLPARLTSFLRRALAHLNWELPENLSIAVLPAADLRFGDYQSNLAMLLAKSRKANPRQLATELTEALGAVGIQEVAQVEIAGAGFVNFRLHSTTFAHHLLEILKDSQLGVPRAEKPKKIVLDFSGPNVAKPMHVGHIRSTIIGDCLARIARFLGHEVVTDNHLGDWGTQFGIILYGWKNLAHQEALEKEPIQELLRLYKEANALAKDDEAIREACKSELVKLQGGDPENLDIWRRCVELSKQGLNTIYERLDIHFDHWLGESAYNDALAPLVNDMLESGLAEISEGAACVFFRDLPALENKPCLVRKADGGFLYATTDLATIEFRIKEWQADEIWYVVGAPQQLHFQQVFEVAKRRGHHTRLVHIPFGSILGPDRKIMRTRSGENVGLAEVLDEGVERSLALVESRNPDLPQEEKEEIARVVGVGVVKYSELSQHRMTDYVFAWEKMLALQGNTAPYLQYSYTRTRSIFRKLEGIEGKPYTFDSLDQITLEAPEEMALARQLARFGEELPLVLEDFRPNLMASYLYDLARSFHSFFEACPVLKAEEPQRCSRLALCEATSRVIKQGLALLGIEVLERM